MEKEREESLRRTFRNAAAPEDLYVQAMEQLDNAAGLRWFWSEAADHYEAQAKKAQALLRECVSDFIVPGGHTDCMCERGGRCVCGLEHLLQRIEAALGENG